MDYRRCAILFTIKCENIVHTYNYEIYIFNAFTKLSTVVKSRL